MLKPACKLSSALEGTTIFWLPSRASTSLAVFDNDFSAGDVGGMPMPGKIGHRSGRRLESPIAHQAFLGGKTRAEPEEQNQSHRTRGGVHGVFSDSCRERPGVSDVQIVGPRPACRTAISALRDKSAATTRLNHSGVSNY